MMVRHAVVAVLVVAAAISIAPASAEESDATGGSTASTPTLVTGTVIGGYTPASDVDEHKKIDQDMWMIQTNATGSDCTAGAAMTKATNIYTNGLNSKKSSGNRKLKSFELKAKEPFGDLFLAYKTAGKHDPHAMFEAALAGADVTTGPAKAKWGTTATGATAGAVAGSCAARGQIVKKVGKFQIMMQYAAHEFEAALAAYANCQYEQAVHYWDEWWAFYAGSLSTDPNNKGRYAPYHVGPSIGSKFGTNTKTTAILGDESEQNCMLLKATKQGLELLKFPGNETKLDDIAKCMRAQLKVGLIQVLQATMHEKPHPNTTLTKSHK